LQLIGKSVLIDTFSKIIFVTGDFPYYACCRVASGIFGATLQKFHSLDGGQAQ
jgi:hypothetical protein